MDFLQSACVWKREGVVCRERDIFCMVGGVVWLMAQALSNVITFDDFESPNRWGNFINTGSDTWVYTKPVSNGGNGNWRIGTGSLAVRNKNGLGATSTTDLTAAVKNLGEIRVKFWAYVFSFEADEDFFLEYTLDGTNWNVAARYINGEAAGAVTVANDDPKVHEVSLTDVDLSSATEFRFRFRVDTKQATTRCSSIMSRSRAGHRVTFPFV